MVNELIKIDLGNEVIYANKQFANKFDKQIQQYIKELNLLRDAFIKKDKEYISR